MATSPTVRQVTTAISTAAATSTVRSTSLVLNAPPTALIPISTTTGATLLPTLAPAVWAASSTVAGTCSSPATSACSDASSALEDVVDPVRNDPSPPINPDSSG